MYKRPDIPKLKLNQSLPSIKTTHTLMRDVQSNNEMLIKMRERLIQNLTIRDKRVKSQDIGVK